MFMEEILYVTMDSLSKFSWKGFSAELESISPTLYAFHMEVKRKARKAMKSIKPTYVAVLGVRACHSSITQKHSHECNAMCYFPRSSQRPFL